MFCKKCSCSRSFCNLHLSMLGVDRYCKRQTLFKCHKKSASNAWKPLVDSREDHLCSRPFGLELRPFKPRTCRVHYLLLSNLTTAPEHWFKMMMIALQSANSIVWMIFPCWCMLHYGPWHDALRSTGTGEWVEARPRSGSVMICIGDSHPVVSRYG